MDIRSAEPIWIYGAVPEPTGGVSVFLSRLIFAGTTKFGGLVDPYYGREKMTLEIPHIRARKPGYWAKLQVLARLLTLRRCPLFINGSRVGTVLLLWPFLAFRTGATTLLLHHGQLESWLSQCVLTRFLLKRALGRFHLIAALSPKQHAFYMSLNVSAERVQLIDTYLPPFSLPDSKFVSPAADRARAFLDGCTGSRVIIGSGYASEFYHHEWGLDFLDAYHGESDLRYLLCCYGPETATLRDLQRRFSDRQDACLVFGLSPEEFDAVLPRCDIYIRPTEVDSYGMAARDAQHHGLSIVASDVCEREPSVLVHAAGDKPGFFSLLEALLDGREIPVSHSVPAKRLRIDNFLKQLSQ